MSYVRIVRNLTREWSAAHYNTTALLYKKQTRDNSFKKITIKITYMHASKNLIQSWLPTYGSKKISLHVRLKTVHISSRTKFF